VRLYISIAAINRPIANSHVIYEHMESHGEMILTGKTEKLGKKQSESHFVHINLTWTNADANPDTGSERQGTA
jgi:hypothetical protein